jgi:uncharacterized membrane protein
MRNLNPSRLIIIGFVLLIIGFILPLLMVLRVIQSTILLNFLAYGSSFSGLVLGIIGSAWYTGRNRKKFH